MQNILLVMYCCECLVRLSAVRELFCVCPMLPGNGRFCRLQCLPPSTENASTIGMIAHSRYLLQTVFNFDFVPKLSLFMTFHDTVF